uniref:helix-turn-helix domain-containing protein n=1 Tax=Phascolarctobacterium succinatutens TaxID=626940 RepID=UPI003078CBC7
MPFNTMLKTLRLKKGLTQGELARLTGLTRSAISMYEAGNREPKYEVLELLADFFNVDMNTLLDKSVTINSLQPAKKVPKDLKKILEDEEVTLNAKIDIGIFVEPWEGGQQ